MKSINMLKKNQLYAIYDDDDETFRVGFFLESDDTFVLFCLITTRGFEDGLYLTDINEIYRIDTNSKYNQRIQKLFEINQQKVQQFNYKCDNSLLVSSIMFAQKAKYCITVRIDNGDVISGTINRIDDELLYLNVIDDDGNFDGESCMELECVDRIWVNSGNERNRLALWNCNQIV